MRRDIKIKYNYNNERKGFWLEERFIEVLSYYVSLIFEKKGLENKPEWYLEVYDDFLTITHGYNTGVQAILFEDNLQFIKDREQEIISVLEDTKELLYSKGKEISLDELRNETESRKITEDLKNGWDFPVQVKSLVAITDLMIQLFKHEWKEDREVWFEGFDHPENADVI